jgi:hypothetical protein
MDRFQVGDLVRTDTGITGRIVTMSEDGQYAYIPGPETVGASLIRFDVSSLEQIEPRPTEK